MNARDSPSLPATTYSPKSAATMSEYLRSTSLDNAECPRRGWVCLGGARPREHQGATLAPLRNERKPKSRGRGGRRARRRAPLTMSVRRTTLARMKASRNRILTSHAGSLPRPDGLIEANRVRETEGAEGDGDFPARLRAAVADVVRHQTD